MGQSTFFLGAGAWNEWVSRTKGERRGMADHGRLEDVGERAKKNAIKLGGLSLWVSKIRFRWLAVVGVGRRTLPLDHATEISIYFASVSRYGNVFVCFMLSLQIPCHSGMDDQRPFVAIKTQGAPFPYQLKCVSPS